MNCHQCRERMLEVVTLSTASSADIETSEIEAHLKDCRDCRVEFNELVDSFALLGMTADSREPSVDISDRVLQRISESRDATRTEEHSPLLAERVRHHDSTRRLSTRQRWLSFGLAASLLFAVVGGQWWYLHRMNKLAMAIHDPSERERLESLEQAVAELQSYEAKARETKLRFVSFRDTDASASVQAYAVFDSMAGQLHFFGFGMEPLPENQVYALWFLKRDGNADLGATFVTDTSGKTNLIANLKSPGSSAAGSGGLPHEIILTIEERAVASKPSGTVWLRATFSPQGAPTSP